MNNAEHVAELNEWADRHERAASRILVQIATSHPSARYTLERRLDYRLGEVFWARREAARITAAKDRA